MTGDCKLLGGVLFLQNVLHSLIAVYVLVGVFCCYHSTNAKDALVKTMHLNQLYFIYVPLPDLIV